MLLNKSKGRGKYNSPGTCHGTEFEQATAENLASLSLQLLEGFNNGSVNRDLLIHLDSDFLGGSISYGEEALRLLPEEHIEIFDRLVSQCPNWRVKATNVSSIIDEKAGRATVCVTAVLSGHFDSLHRERVSEITWERKSGAWIATKHAVLKTGGQLVARDGYPVYRVDGS